MYKSPLHSTPSQPCMPQQRRRSSITGLTMPAGLTMPGQFARSDFGGKRADVKPDQADGGGRLTYAESASLLSTEGGLSCAHCFSVRTHADALCRAYVDADWRRVETSRRRARIIVVAHLDRHIESALFPSRLVSRRQRKAARSAP